MRSSRASFGKIQTQEINVAMKNLRALVCIAANGKQRSNNVLCMKRRQQRSVNFPQPIVCLATALPCDRHKTNAAPEIIYQRGGKKQEA